MHGSGDSGNTNACARNTDNQNQKMLAKETHAVHVIDNQLLSHS